MKGIDEGLRQVVLAAITKTAAEADTKHAEHTVPIMKYHTERVAAMDAKLQSCWGGMADGTNWNTDLPPKLTWNSLVQHAKATIRKSEVAGGLNVQVDEATKVEHTVCLNLLQDGSLRVPEGSSSFPEGPLGVASVCLIVPEGSLRGPEGGP